MTWSLKRTVKMSKVLGIAESIIKGLEHGEVTLSKPFSVLEKHMYDSFRANEANSDLDNNILALGDNLEFMSWLLENGYEGKFKCIYIDPPFFTKSKYDATVEICDSDGKINKVKHLAYDDTFDRSIEQYVENMTTRLVIMKRLLADDGLIWVHLDWHSAHYVKLAMDEIFGYENMRNEIIWKYKSGGSAKTHFSRKHDTILMYSKSKKYSLDVPKEKSYNRDFKPYRFKGVKEYQDEYGWYTLVNMKDVWSIDMVGRTSSERNGYATQKPLELMKRIISSCTEKGDLVGDFFCGSGSFLKAANDMDRCWVGCDVETLALGTAKKRLDACESNYLFYGNGVERPYRADAIIKIERADELENGKKLCHARLMAFRPELEIGYVQHKDRELLQNACKSSPESLIDYIMIDPDYNGEFSAEISVTDNYDDIKFISRGNVAYIVVDIFGKEYLVK